jgi:hypothetical protein
MRGGLEREIFRPPRPFPSCGLFRWPEKGQPLPQCNERATSDEKLEVKK